VTLLRDSFGVPHVYAVTDEGAMYGLGWASAEDRLFQMLWSRLMAEGRVAEVFGPGFISGKGNTHVGHDRKARYMGWRRHAVRVVSLMAADRVALLDAYAAGVNDYMQSPGAQLHPLIGQNNVPLDPWQAEDCIAVWLRFARHFSGDGGDEVTRLREWEVLLNDPLLTFNQAYNQMISGVVCDEQAAVVQLNRVPAATLNAINNYAAQFALNGAGTCPVPLPGPHFSQSWAVSGARTTTGRAVLVGEPRGEVFAPNKYMEWAVEGNTFGVRGIGVPGSPVLVSGSTASVAWSPTALGMDQADLFSLTINPGNSGQYWYDGQWVDFAIDENELIVVKGAANVNVNYRETVWGPVVTPVLPGVLPGEEFAVKRVPLLDPARETTTAVFDLYRAANLDAFVAALEGWSWPPVNMVFADSAGRIGYSVVGDIPVRNPALVHEGLIAQDGSTSASDWLDRLPWGLQPHVIDPPEGFVMTANHMPVGAWYPIPVRFGSGSAGDTQRSRRLRERLEALPATPTPTEVFGPRLDVVHPSRRDMVELGLWLLNRQPSHVLSPAAQSALGQLEPWWVAGAPMDDSLPGSTLAWLMSLIFRETETGPAMITQYGGGDNALNLFLKTKIADIRAAVPVPLAPDEAAYVDKVLADAWVAALLLGPPNGWVAWFQNNVLTYQVTSWLSLERFPPLTAQTIGVGPVRCADAQTLFSPRNQGYTQLVEVGAPDQTNTLLPPGQSEHAGPQQQSQVNLWEGESVKSAPLTKAAVLASGPVATTELSYTKP
jgi:penicillin amidase